MWDWQGPLVQTIRHCSAGALSATAILPVLPSRPSPSTVWDVSSGLNAVALRSAHDRLDFILKLSCHSRVRGRILFRNVELF